MDQSIIDGLIAVVAGAGGAGLVQSVRMFWPKAKKVEPSHDGVPMIEIDGEMVPHPTALHWKRIREAAK